MLKIEFLYWEDCPSHPEAWQLLQEVLAEEGLDWPVERIQVAGDLDAQRWDFPGSPTIRVDGKDLDPPGADQMGVALACRVYRLDSEEGSRFSPVPSREMIRRGLLAARGDAAPGLTST
ncbi:MAG: hypothetical protein EHM56_09685 [Chloroflexi bacterium]|nr:MAG: hypothetical protein EHM56_09685 [Chloroflexota bacterium]